MLRTTLVAVSIGMGEEDPSALSDLANQTPVEELAGSLVGLKDSNFTTSRCPRMANQAGRSRDSSVESFQSLRTSSPPSTETYSRTSSSSRSSPRQASLDSPAYMKTTSSSFSSRVYPSRNLSRGYPSTSDLSQLRKGGSRRQSLGMKPAHQSSSDDNLELFVPSSTSTLHRSLLSSGLPALHLDGCGLDALFNQAPLGMPRTTSALDALVAMPDGETSPFYVSEENRSPPRSALPSHPAPASSKRPFARTRNGSSQSLCHPISEPDYPGNLFPVSAEQRPLDSHWPYESDCAMFVRLQADLTSETPGGINQPGFQLERDDSAFKLTERGDGSCSSLCESHHHLGDYQELLHTSLVDSLGVDVLSTFRQHPLESRLNGVDFTLNRGDSAGILFANSLLLMQAGPSKLGRSTGGMRKSLSTSALAEC